MYDSGAQYSYQADDGLWEAGQQRRVRRDVTNDTGKTEMSTQQQQQHGAMSATDSVNVAHRPNAAAAEADDDANADDVTGFYGDTDYYDNLYDNVAAYDDYQFSHQSQYNKV